MIGCMKKKRPELYKLYMYKDIKKCSNNQSVNLFAFFYIQ